MTLLQREALKRTPLTSERIASIYRSSKKYPFPDMMIRDLCLSHERLRMELEGAEKLLAEAGVYKP